MTDGRVGRDIQPDEIGLPWLDDSEEEARGSPLLKIIGWVFVSCVVLALGFSGGYWLRNREAPSSPILAEHEIGPLAPAIVTDGGQTKFASNEGESGRLEAVSDAATAGSAAAPAHRAVSGHAVKRKAHRMVRRSRGLPRYDEDHLTILAKVRAEQRAPDKAIQLGAYTTPAIADGVWNSLRWRFGFLKPLTAEITSVTVGGRQLYSLRATGPHADLLCQWLRQAREPCVDVEPTRIAQLTANSRGTVISGTNRARKS